MTKITMLKSLLWPSRKVLDNPVMAFCASFRWKNLKLKKFKSSLTTSHYVQVCSNPFIDWISLIKRVNAAEQAEYNSISAAQSLRSSRVQWCPCEFSQGTTVSTWPCDIPRNCIALIPGCMRKKKETFEFRNNVGGE